MTITKNCNIATIRVTLLQYRDHLLAMRVPVSDYGPERAASARLLISGALDGAKPTPDCQCLHRLFARRGRALPLHRIGILDSS